MIRTWFLFCVSAATGYCNFLSFSLSVSHTKHTHTLSSYFIQEQQQLNRPAVVQFNLSVRFSHLHHHHLSLMCATEEKSRKWISTTTGIKRTEKLSKQSTTAEIMLRFSPFLVDPVAKVFFFLSSVCFSFHSALYYIRLEILLLGIISFVCLLYVAVSTLIPCRFACFPFVHVCVRSCFFFFFGSSSSLWMAIQREMKRSSFFLRPR